MPSSEYIRCLEENYTADSYYSKYCIYFVIIVVAITMAPYDFRFEESHSFSWKYQSFDILTNLFLFSPIGFFLTLLKKELNLKYFSGLLLLGLLGSFLIESVQLFLVQRASQYWDVICNVASLLMGALGAALILKLIAHKETANGNHSSIFLSPLILIGLFLAMRTINSGGVVDGIILSFTFISTGIITITLSHLSKARIKSLPYYAFFGSMAYLFICTFPLLLHKPITYLTILLVFPIIVSLSALFLAEKSAFFLLKFRKSLSIILLLLCIYHGGSVFYEFNSILIDLSVTSWDKVKLFKQGSGLGAVIVEYILLAGILIELTKYTFLMHDQGQIYSFILFSIPVFIVAHWYMYIFSYTTPNNTNPVYFLYAAIIIITWQNKLITQQD